MQTNYKWIFSSVAIAAIGAVVMYGCGSGDKPAETTTTGGTTGTTPPAGTDAAGTINVDGSSTVFPVTSAIAEDFKGTNPKITVNVQQAGTGAGIKKFLAKEIDICDASRAIDSKEIDDAKTKGVEFIELPIAYDGLSIVVNPKNTWVASMTVEELKKIWEEGSKVKNWNEVNPKWPAKPIKLFGPTSAHGSFEYFTEAINKKKKSSRSDYEQCADYNQLIAGVSQEEGALGYVGYGYVKENADKVKIVGVDAGKGVMMPTAETIANGTYSPLSRPLMIYINKDAAAKPEVKAFISYYFGEGKKQVGAQGYIPLSDALYAKSLDRFNKATTGSVLTAFKPGDKLEDILGK